MVLVMLMMVVKITIITIISRNFVVLVESCSLSMEIRKICYDGDDDNHNLGGVHRPEPGRPLPVARDRGGRHLRNALRLEEIAHTCHCSRKVEL